MTFLNHLCVDLQDVETRFFGKAPERGDGHLHVLQFVFFAVV